MHYCALCLPDFKKTTASIMMVAGFIRVLAPGMLLLFATTITTLLNPSGTITVTASSTPTDDDDAAEACPTQVTNCRVDGMCFACMEDASSSRSSKILSCYKMAGVDDVESSTATCADIMGAVCCLDEVSQFECLANDAYAEYWACYLELFGCSEVIITCDDDSDIGSGVDDDSNNPENDDRNGDGNDDGNDDKNDAVDSAESTGNGATAVSVGHNWTVHALYSVVSLLLPLLLA